MNLIGNCYLSLADAQKSLEYYEEIEMFLNLDMETKLECDLSGLFMNKGLAHFYLGNPSAAQQYYQKALQVNEHILGNANIHQQNAKIYTNLAVLHDSAGRIEEALSLYEKAFKIRKRNLGTNHPELVELQYNITCINLQLNKVTETIPQFEQVLQQMKSILGNDHPKIGSVCYSLGVAYSLAFKFQKALKCL